MMLLSFSTDIQEVRCKPHRHEHNFFVVGDAMLMAGVGKDATKLFGKKHKCLAWIDRALLKDKTPKLSFCDHN